MKRQFFTSRLDVQALLLGILRNNRYYNIALTVPSTLAYSIAIAAVLFSCSQFFQFTTVLADSHSAF